MDAMVAAVLRSDPTRRRALEATGLLSSPQRRDAAAYLPDEQKATMMSALARQAGGALDVAGRVLDYPGAIARGFLTGDPASGFSWDSDRRVSGAEMLEKAGFLSKDANPYYRAFAGLAAEIATDPLSIISGPANALSKAGKAAKAAGILGHAQDAALATMGIDRASKTLRTGRNAAQFLENLLPGGSKQLVTPDLARYRPLVGPRVARSTTTLEETIKHSRDPNALEKVQAYLAKQGLRYDDVKGQKLGGALALNYFGLIDPIVFNTQNKTVLGALDLLDAGGQMARWSSLSRGAGAFVDQRVGGKTSAYDQIMNLRQWDDMKAAQGAARAAGAKHAYLVGSTNLTDEAKRLLGADSLNSEQGSDFLTRLAENVPTQSDMAIRNAIGPERTQAIVDSWNTIRRDIKSQADDLGMVSRKMKDPYGVEWSPRVAREANFGDYGKGLSRQTFYARSLENEARKKYLMTPGGTVDLRQINALPKVQQFIREGERSGLSISDVGAEIKRFLDAKHGADTPQARQYLQSLGMQYDPRATPFDTFVPKLGPDGKVIREAVLDDSGNPVMVAVKNKRGAPVIDKATGQPKMQPKTRVVFADDEVISQSQAEKIARFYMRKDKSVADDVGMFSEHPLTSQVRATVAQATARANAEEVYRSLGEAAVPVGSHADTFAGTNRKPLDRALNEVALATGLKTSQKTGAATKAVQDILRREIAARHGIADPRTINLSQWTLPEPVLNRLTAINDFYSRPRAQDDVMNLFGQIGQIFKGFLLAFPSRFTRDMYSNGFQLWLLGRNPADVGWGLNAAAKIMAGQTDEAAALLKTLPGYNLADAGAIKGKLVEDVARTGILQTLSSSDLLTSNKAAELNQLVPGFNPMRPLDFVKELTPDGSRNPLQMVGDYFTFKGTRIPGLQKVAAGETKNAILNASQKANDYIDSVSRLGGMLMLMRQGVTADEAARRVTEALVDYNSLTSFERNVMKTIFPWYSYSSRAGKFAVQELFTNPGGAYAQVLRGFNRLQESDEDTYIPEALRQQFAIRVPDSVKNAIGIGKSDTTTFLRDIDIPGHDVISLLSPGPGIYKPVQSTFYNLVQQSNPLIQTIVELSTGTDLFSRRPLEQADTSLDRVYKALTGSKTNMNPLVRQAIELTPAPRISGIVGGLVDPRIPMEQRVIKQLINTLTGVKLQDVDAAYQLSDARRILGDELGGYMRDYADSYIPKDVLPEVPPELMPKYELFRRLGKDLRDRRKERAAK